MFKIIDFNFLTATNEIKDFFLSKLVVLVVLRHYSVENKCIYAINKCH